MNEKILSTFFLQHAEEIAPAAAIDLWLPIQARMLVKPVVNRSFLRTGLVPIALVAILLFTFVAATPQGRALAQELRSLFFRTEPDLQVRDPSILPTTPIPAVITPIAGAQEGEELIGWHVYQPTWLPDGYILHQMDTRPRTEMIVQEYVYEKTIGMAGSYFYIGQRIEPFNELWPVGESAQVESVMVGDNPGEYVIGAWGVDDPVKVWQAIPNIQHLRWQADGYYFDLQFNIVGVEPDDLMDSPYYLSKEALIAIAESME